jgi:AGZA family xanthine/uracil permease-like MFS transporter
MILAAISAFLIDRKFYSAALWSILAAFCTTLGLMHAFQVEGNSINYLFNLTLPFLQTPAAPPEGVYYYRALTVAVGYLLAAGAFAWCGWYQARHPVAEGAGH